MLITLLLLGSLTAMPIEISTIEQLQLIGNDPAYPLSGDYVLTQGIGDSETDITPIADAASFTGTLDGNNHTITGQITSLLGSLIHINSGVVRRVRTNLVVSGGYELSSALCGMNYGTIESCRSGGSVITTGGVTGGLAGLNQGTILLSSNGADVSGDGLVGGICGANSGSVINSYSTGDVSGTDSVGGAIGANRGVVRWIYATGAVSGDSNVGGVIGINDTDPPYDPEVTSAYYDAQTTGQSDTGKGTPKTTAQMKQQATFVGWDFDAVWYVDEGVAYPIHGTFHYVTFDLDEKGTRAGGGELQQFVVHGNAAQTPLVAALTGYVFDGWDKPLDNITEDTTITALYTHTMGIDPWRRMMHVTQDPKRKGLWFSSADGNSYYLNEHGMSGPFKRETLSVALVDGAWSFTGRTTGDQTAVEMKTAQFDMANNGQKRVTIVNVQADNISDLTVQSHFRYKHDEPYRTREPVRCNPVGAAYVNVSLVTGQLTIKGVAEPGSRLTRIETRYQSHDKRFIRGTRGFSGTGEGDDNA